MAQEVGRARIPWLLLALGCAMAAIADVAWGWRHGLQVLGSDVPARRVLPWFFVGEIAKYVPGGIWSVVGRAELATRGGVDRRRAYASVALSLVAAYLAAMVVAVALLPFAAGGAAGWYWLCLLVLPVGVIALHPACSVRWWESPAGCSDARSSWRCRAGAIRCSW